MYLTAHNIHKWGLAAVTAGYTWLWFNASNHKDVSADICLFKHVTSIPCPSCGSTRSAISFLEGQFTEAFLINPLGIVVLTILLALPIWLAYDFLNKQNSMFRMFQKAEAGIKNPRIAPIVIALIVINWFWSISKGL